MTAQNVIMFAPSGGGGALQGVANVAGNQPFIAADGTVGVDPSYVPVLLRAGFKVAALRHVTYNTPGSPAAKAVGAGVASVALANGTLTVAGQPSMARQYELRVDPGAAAITAGVATVTYTANDGSTQVDVLSLITGSGVLKTIKTSKGVEHLTSAIVTGLAGGSTPKVELNTNDTIALPIPLQVGSISVTRESVISTTTIGISTGANEAVGTQGDNGLITPTTIPNSTQQLSFGYSYYAP